MFALRSLCSPIDKKGIFSFFFYIKRYPISWTEILLFWKICHLVWYPSFAFFSAMTHLMQKTPILCATLAPPGHFCIHIFSFFYNGTAILGFLLASTPFIASKLIVALSIEVIGGECIAQCFPRSALFGRKCAMSGEGKGGLPLGCQRETRNDGFVA